MNGHVSTMPVGLFALWYTINSVLWAVYTVGMHARYGQTLGKMVMKVMVLDVSERCRINFRQALMRDLVPLIVTIAFLPHQLIKKLAGTSHLMDKGAQPELVNGVYGLLLLTWFLMEVTAMIASSKRRAVHDFIARTVVIRT